MDNAFVRLLTYPIIYIVGVAVAIAFWLCVGIVFKWFDDNFKFYMAKRKEVNETIRKGCLSMVIRTIVGIVVSLIVLSIIAYFSTRVD